MKKKFLAILLACAALFTAGCGSIGTNSSQWIDSSIKGNVTADTVVSLKDDFAAAANQALYASGESEGRTIVNISRMVTDRKRALLSDTSVTGKGIEEVRKYAALAEDHAGRQALGVTPLEPYLRSIESITSVEDLYAWIADPAANPLGVSPVAVTGPGRSQVAPSSYFVLLGNASFTLARQNGASDSYFSMNETDLEKMVMVEDKVTCVLEQMGYSEQDVARNLDMLRKNANLTAADFGDLADGFLTLTSSWKNINLTAVLFKSSDCTECHCVIVGNDAVKCNIVVEEIRHIVSGCHTVVICMDDLCFCQVDSCVLHSIQCTVCTQICVDKAFCTAEQYIGNICLAGFLKVVSKKFTLIFAREMLIRSNCRR